jgi:hypothetical protein
MKHLAMALILCLPALFSCAQSGDSLLIAKVADEILVNGKAYDNLRVLCKTVGGRLSGSPEMYKAEAWGVKALEAAGANKVYLQECMVPHWTRGGKDEAWYSFKDAKGKLVKEKLYVLALGNSIGTANAGVKAPVMLVHDFNELERRKDEIRGKVVFFNYPFNERYLQTFRAYGEAGIYRHSGPSRAAKYGAVAVVIRSLSGSTDNYPHTGSMRYDSNYAKIPCAAMGLRDADKLAALLQQGKQIELYYRSHARFLPDTVGHNVIGEFTGIEFPNEYITVGGHLDSWDPAEGAHDDGAGCVHSIEVLRALKAVGYHPRRTIRVVLFANEENGLRGGREYAEQAKLHKETHLFALESDAGGFTPRSLSISLRGGALNSVRRWLPLLLPYGVYAFNEGGGGADVSPLAALGATVAELQPDGQRYFDYHHTPNDVFENVNKRELELGAINMTAVIYLIDKYGL